MSVTETIIKVRLTGLGPEHPVTQEATGELLADLKRVSELRPREHTVSSEGAKGGPVEILVTLGTPGAIAGLVQIVKLWLTRDRRRSLRVSVRNTADGHEIKIEGEEVSIAVLNEALSVIKADHEADNKRNGSSPDQRQVDGELNGI